MNKEVRGRNNSGKPGLGSYGGGRGTDYDPASSGDTLPNGDTAHARGNPQPEHMKEGWGGPGENYTTAQPLSEARKDPKPDDQT